MKLDGTLGSHPIVQTVETPSQITEIFDLITYDKGASVIRMLENFVGMDRFAKGVTAYLKKHQYQNAKTTDLLHQLQMIVGEEMDLTSVIFLYIYIHSKIREVFVAFSLYLQQDYGYVDETNGTSCCYSCLRKQKRRICVDTKEIPY